MYIVGEILILFIGIASYTILTNSKAKNDEKKLGENNINLFSNWSHWFSFWETRKQRYLK